MRNLNIILLFGLSTSLLGKTNSQTIQKPTIPEKGVGIKPLLVQSRGVKKYINLFFDFHLMLWK